MSTGLNNDARFFAAARLIKAATGHRYGDGEIVAEVGTGADGDPEQVWVRGNWNNPREFVNGERVETSTIPERLHNALSRIDVLCVFSDDHRACSECGTLVETQPSSAFWAPEFVNTLDGILCSTCVMGSAPSELFDTVTGEHEDARGISFDNAAHWLAGWGWRKVNEQEYRSGFHPGDNDTPESVLSSLRSKEFGDRLFILVSGGSDMFTVRYDVWAVDSIDQEHDEYRYRPCAHCGAEIIPSGPYGKSWTHYRAMSRECDYGNPETTYAAPRPVSLDKEN